MKTKIIVGVILFLSGVASAGLVAAGLLSKQQNRNGQAFQAPLSGRNNSQTRLQADTLQASGQAALVLDIAEVARHNTANDCWMVISNNVYNVTNAMGAHPGGQAAMLPYCGRDGTQAFATKDKGSDHSGNAYAMLKDYLLGALDQEIAAASAAGVEVATPSGGMNQSFEPAATAAIKTPAAPATIALTSAVVAKHNTSGDCWMTISGTVYDVSAAMRPHPGGIDAILRHCGTDATTAFATKDEGDNHSSNAYAMLANYALGKLDASVSQAAVEQAQSVPPPASSGEGDDDGDDEEEEEYEDD